MKCLSQVRVESRNGVVQLIVSDGMEQGCVALSPEVATRAARRRSTAGQSERKAEP